jgi:two-component system response regulator YesN
MLKVLIVDDERYVCESLINALDWEELGFEKPLSASNGKVALEIIKHGDIGLVITDVKMPVMDGLGLARYINKFYTKINIIFISAYDEFQYARQAMEFGVKSYLLKPVEKDILKDTVVRVMNLKDFKQDNAGMKLDSEDVNAMLVRKVQKYILDNFDRKISLSEVAEQMFISPQHLCKKFKKITGMQFVDYVLNVKIKKAKSLIMNTSIKVKDLAIQLGFNDYTYFCKVFKKYEGVSPLQYRAKFVLLDKLPEAASGEDEYV